MHILNLYAGIGGNRKLWPEGHEVVAVEFNPEIAAIYQSFFPKDKVIIADAHQYLLDHYKEYDFIWSSPPCPSHSQIRFMASKHGDYNEVYPDMTLYQEILFLKHFFKGLWVVENVNPYYEPLIKPFVASRHFFWANFIIDNKFVEQRNHNKVTGKTKLYGFDLTNFKIEHRKDQIIRNMVHPILGLYVFNCAFKEKQQVLEITKGVQ
jgi:DNA (cytosine-5)-methyltransferase 1